VDAGHDLPRAFVIAADAVRSPTLRYYADELSDSLARGRPLAEASSVGVPMSLLASIDLASHAGNLPATLEGLTAMYQRQVEHRLATVRAQLMPFVLIVMAMIIGVMILAVFAPLPALIQSVMSGGF